MGQVYKAFDTALDRVVAVRILSTHLSEDARFRERFRRESHATARLREPHIIPIHNYGEIDGHLYLEMPLVEGTDLRRMIAQAGPLAPATAVAVLTQAAEAIDAAHDAGLVHRDVKPANILVTGRGFVYLIDFGIAQAVGDSGLTSAGSTVGTFAYMAPERLANGVTDRRSDVYALTCVLHECLTGVQPFPRTSVEQQITAHLTAPPPRPRLLRPSLPPAFDQVVAVGRAKKAEDRYPSAGALAAAAHAALAGAALPGAGQRPIAGDATVTSAPMATPAPAPEPPPAPTPGPAPPPEHKAPRRRAGVVAAAVAVAAVAAAGIWAVTADRDTPATTTGAGGSSASDRGPRAAAPTYTVAATIQVGRGAANVALDEPGGLLYVSNLENASVSVVDTSARAVDTTFQVGPYPEGVAVDPGAGILYVTSLNGDAVSLVDTGTGATTATVPVGLNPSSAAVDPRTGTAYVTNSGDDTLSVVDGSTRAVVATVPTGSFPDGIAVDPQTGTVFVTNLGSNDVTVVDGASRAVTATVPVGTSPDRPAFDAGTGLLYTANRDENTISAVDTRTFAETRSGKVGNLPAGVGVDSRRRLAFVALADQDAVAVVDLATLQVAATVPVPGTPVGVAVDPAGTVFVTSRGSGTVTVLAPGS